MVFLLLAVALVQVNCGEEKKLGDLIAKLVRQGGRSQTSTVEKSHLTEGKSKYGRKTDPKRAEAIAEAAKQRSRAGQPKCDYWESCWEEWDWWGPYLACECCDCWGCYWC